MSQDDFSDVRGLLSRQGFGALGGDGADALTSYKSSVARDNSGVDYQLYCDSCGQPVVVTPNWAEFVYGMCGIKPPNWEYSARHGGFYPNVGCPTCRHLVMLIFTPAECKKQVDAGVASGGINAQQVQGMVAQLRRGG